MNDKESILSIAAVLAAGEGEALTVLALQRWFVDFDSKTATFVTAE